MASYPIYQFYAELQDYEPKIWRRFQMMNNATMAKLGYILMSIFELQANHQFCFEVPLADNFSVAMAEELDSEEKRQTLSQVAEELKLATVRIDMPDEDDLIGTPDGDIDDEDDDFPGLEGVVLDATMASIRHIVKQAGEKIRFIYDFGDNWQVLLTLEEVIIDKALPGKELPRVLAGAGYGIIEDCGGPQAMAQLAEDWARDGGRPQRQLREALEQPVVDLAAFDLADCNYRLRRLPRIFMDIYEYHLEPSDRALRLLERKL